MQLHVSMAVWAVEASGGMYQVPLGGLNAARHGIDAI